MKAEQLRKSILQLAIQGKLVPQNPDDEPASVLLERIRAEKQRLIKQGKIKKDKGDSVIFKGDDNCYYEKCGSEVKNITEELPFEIPDSWCWTKLGSLITVISGVSYDKKDVCSQGIRILRGGNIYDQKIHIAEDDVFLPQKYYDPDKQVQKDDIVIVASTGSKTVIGKSGFANKDYPQTEIGAFLRIVRPFYNNIAEYLKTIFATEYYREHIRTLAQGTNINNVKAEYITELKIPFPPIEEQKRIVAEIEKFESLIAEYDKLEQQATKLDSEIYDKLKKSILQYAIQGKLVPQNSNDEPATVLLERIRAEKKTQFGKKYVESYIYKGDDNCYYEHINGKDIDITEEVPFNLPNGWAWSRLDNLALYKKGPFGSSLTKDMFVPKSEISVKVYEQKNAIYKDCSLGNYYVSVDKYETMKSFEVFPDDIIVSCAGTIGETYVLPKNAPKGIINQALMKIKLFEQSIIEFYLIYFDYILKGQAQKSSKGSAIKNIPPFDILKRMMMPIPPLAEQKRIVDKINAIFAKL